MNIIHYLSLFLYYLLLGVLSLSGLFAMGILALQVLYLVT